MPALEIRDLTVDDLDDVLTVRTRAFGGVRSDWQERERALMEAQRSLGVVSGGRVVAAARILPMRQWWGGRKVSMSGIGGVAVAPEERGRGVGSLLMQAIVDRVGELGDAVSALYPATVPVYRRLGWEYAGAQHRVSIATEALRGLRGGGARVVPAGPDDAATVVAAVRAVHERDGASGPLAHSEDETRHLLESADVFSYRCDDGFCSYRWQGDDLLVQELTAGSTASARALWSVVGSGSSTAGTVHAYVSPRDPLPLLLEAPVLADAQAERWMLRLLDVGAAVAARGFPAGVSCEAALSIEDAQVSRNDGDWLLRVEAGRGELVPGGPGGVRLDARGAAAMYAGVPLPALRVAGLATGGRPDDAATLDAAFAAVPYLLDYF
jgi:predicted acetyltransferase